MIDNKTYFNEKIDTFFRYKDGKMQKYFIWNYSEITNHID